MKIPNNNLRQLRNSFNFETSILLGMLPPHSYKFQLSISTAQFLDKLLLRKNYWIAEYYLPLHGQNTTLRVQQTIPKLKQNEQANREVLTSTIPTISRKWVFQLQLAHMMVTNSDVMEWRANFIMQFYTLRFNSVWDVLAVSPAGFGNYVCVSGFEWYDSFTCQ